MSKKITTEEFIERAKKVHGDKYDYSLVEYKNNKTKVKIICSIHGVFEQVPSYHLYGSGCPKCCGGVKNTTNDFIEKAKKVHGDKYDYSLVEYVNSVTPVKIICPIHGVFEQKAYSHLNGNGCPKCSGKYHKTTEDFIKLAKEIHGDKYDYSLTKFVSNKSNVKIICPIHGVFEQIADVHLNGNGCPKCSGKYHKTTEDFIKLAKEIHGDKYDYSLVEYVNSVTPVKIICHVHGVFEQTPKCHLHGNGCKKCAKNIKSNTEDFIKRAKKIHGDNYDYSLVKYVNNGTPVKIICPVHGVFEQTPHGHLSGHGCPKCIKNIKSNTEDFIKRAKEIHGDKYDYSLVEYVNSVTPVKIICPVHGVFEQTPSVHLNSKSGCQKCKNNYKLEKEIKSILQKENIDNTTQKKFNWLKYKRYMSLDFYIPEYNVAIECQGKQHFKQVEHFGGEDGFIGRIDRDKKKRELCEQHGIKVFYYANYQYDFPYKVYTNPEELIAEIKKIDSV